MLLWLYAGCEAEEDRTEFTHIYHTGTYSHNLFYLDCIFFFHNRFPPKKIYLVAKSREWVLQIRPTDFEQPITILINPSDTA